MTEYQTYAKYFTGMFVFGVLYGFVIFPKALKMSITKQLQLRPGTKTREEMYLPIPFDIEFTVTMWNITNPDEVQAGGIPIMKEVGPYHFIERKLKYNVEDDEETDTMTFDESNTFYFMANKTLPLTGHEVIVIPHIVIAMGLITVQRNQAPLLPMAMEGLTDVFDHPTSPFLVETVYNLLFDGIPVNCDREAFQSQAVCQALEENLGEKSVINDTHLALSLFRAQNGTSNGRFTVYRGIKNIHDVGKMVSFNGETEMDAFDGDECNEIKGTDGLFYPPFLNEDDVIWSFSSAICRSLGVFYKNDSNYQGVALKRFSTTFGKNDPDCFCRDPDECHPYGTLDLSMCLGAPLILSKPHFLDADPSLLTKVRGLVPDEEKYDIIADFELFAGAPLYGRSGAQFNLDMEAVESYPPMANLPTAFLPIFWVSESFGLNKTFVNQFKALHFATKVSNLIKYIFTIVGIIGFGTSVYMTYSSTDIPIEKEVIVVKEVQPSNMYPDGLEHYYKHNR